VQNDGNGDVDNVDNDEGHHLLSPSLPSLPSWKMMGRKGKRKRKMAIWHMNAGVVETGRASS
jgi:hypothetical protein